MWYLTNFLGGLIAFFSPCTLPLLPAYLAYLSGISLLDVKNKVSFSDRKKIFFHSLFFVLGFSLIFVLLGITATALGRFFFNNQLVFQKIGAVVVVIFGLNFLGILKLNFLIIRKKFDVSKKPVGYWETFIFGTTFGFSWTPCIGPILATLLFLAASQASVVQGALGLLVFSAGFGIPFIIAGVFLHWLLNNFGNVTALLKWANLVAGIFLLVTGILMFFGLFTYISGFLSSLVNFQGI